MCLLSDESLSQTEERFKTIKENLLTGIPPISISVGIAEWDRVETDEALITRADAALLAYRADRIAQQPAP